MIRLEFPGALYADNLPSGEWAVLTSSHMRTHLGEFELPDSDYPLYHRITAKDGFQIAGQGHTTQVTWHWKNGEWLRQPVCHGVSGCIFDANGVLHMITPPNPGTPVTSQGYRYVSPMGRLVLGDDTKGPRFGLSEYTDLSDDQDGGLMIGQGHKESSGPDDGAHVRIEGQLRLLQPSFCQFIRAHRVDELVSIAMWTRRLSDEHPDGGALLLWLTLAELKALPLSDLWVPPVHIPAVNRRMWVGWFEFDTPTQMPPGNCVLAVNPAAAELSLPTILGNATTSAGPVIAQYIQGDTVDQIEHLAAKAGRPVVAYWDTDRKWPRLPNLPPGSWTCVKGYRLKGESITAFEADLTRLIGTMADRQVAVVCQCYTSNTAHTTDLASLVPVYARLAQIPHVTMLLGFSDSGRATGLNDHPDVRPLWDTLASTVTAPPIVMAIQPRFTISEPTFPITAQIQPGGSFTFRAVAQLEPGAGEPDWIEWRYSKTGAAGPWTVAVRNPGFDKDHTFKVDKAGTFWFGATAGNAAGTHHTGAERKVTVTEAATQPQPQPQPQPTPQPQPGAGVVFKTANGQFLSQGPNGLIEARATSAETAARIVATKDGDLWTLKTGEKFIRAKDGGGSSLLADRDVPGPDEHFTLILGGDGLWTIQTRTMLFAHAEFGGGGKVLANKLTAGAHEFFDAPIKTVQAPNIARRTGRVRADNRCFADDGGPFNALSCSLFYGLSAYRDRRDVFDANCQFLAEHGFHAFRVMSELGPPLFSDRVADPNAADYDASLTGMIDYAYDVFGLRTELVIFGGTDFNTSIQQREAHVDRIARLLNDRKDRIHFVEIINEGWQTFHGGTLADIKRLAQRFRSSSDLLVATTDSPDWDTGHEQTYGGSVANVSTVHLPRDQTEDGWRAVRQPWEARQQHDPSLMANDEPVGPESSVAQDRDPMRLVMHAVVTYISGLSHYTLHTGAGVTGGNGQDSHARSTVNVFDYPEVREAAKGYLAMQAYLPPDLANWQKQNWHWGGHPFHKSMEGQNWPNDGSGRGVVNDYGATSGQQFITAPSGLRGHYDVKARANMAFDVINPLTGEVVQHVTLNGGQSHRLAGLTAFVLKGQFT